MPVCMRQSNRFSDLVDELQNLVAAIDHPRVRRQADIESLANSHGQPTDVLEKGLRCVSAAAIDVAQDLIKALRSPERSAEADSSRQPGCSLIHRLDLTQQDCVSHAINYSDLAAKRGIDEVAFRCYLRYAITNRVFLEPEHAVSAQCQAIDALIKWPKSKHAAETVHASSPNTPFWEDIGRKPGNATRTSTTGEAASPEHLVNGYPWETVSQGGEVVDIAGRTGNTAVFLAECHPHLRVTLQDLSKTLRNVVSPSNLNVRFMVHDMFATQPIVGADVYMFQWVLHRWFVNPDLWIVHHDGPLQLTCYRSFDKCIVNPSSPPQCKGAFDGGTCSTMGNRPRARGRRYQVGSSCGSIVTVRSSFSSWETSHW